MSNLWQPGRKAHLVHTRHFISCSGTVLRWQNGAALLLWVKLARLSRFWEGRSSSSSSSSGFKKRGHSHYSAKGSTPWIWIYTAFATVAAFILMARRFWSRSHNFCAKNTSAAAAAMITIKDLTTSLCIREMWILNSKWPGSWFIVSDILVYEKPSWYIWGSNI